MKCDSRHKEKQIFDDALLGKRNLCIFLQSAQQMKLSTVFSCFSYSRGFDQVYIFDAIHKRKLHFPRSWFKGLRH